jgi:oxygen-independent coproporphyrinogen-3 oxidase
LSVVKEAGFENFNLDLIYASPTQSLAELSADLEAALEFRPPHVSAYNLTFEEGTPFYHDYRNGKMTSLGEDEEIAMAELIETKLAGAGLRRYEISNYARPDYRSRHNVNYWRYGDYLGLGAGAHSYWKVDSSVVSGRRWSNEKNPARYMALVSKNRQAVVEREAIDRLKAAGEFMFLGLRMIEGISTDAFTRRFDKPPVEFYPKIRDWLEANLLSENEGRLRLTRRGLLVANSIFVELM